MGALRGRGISGVLIGGQCRWLLLTCNTWCRSRPAAVVAVVGAAVAAAAAAVAQAPHQVQLSPPWQPSPPLPSAGLRVRLHVASLLPPPSRTVHLLYPASDHAPSLPCSPCSRPSPRPPSPICVRSSRPAADSAGPPGPAQHRPQHRRREDGGCGGSSRGQCQVMTMRA